jgi:uncharacterized protein
MAITVLFVALLAPFYILLALPVIGTRCASKVSLGDGGNASLMRRMRVHANFAENVPIAVILLGLAESIRARGIGRYIVGAVL